MKPFILIGVLAFISCDMSRQIVNTESISISLNKMQCGSYEVKNYRSSIVYVVKPFIIEIENKSAKIAKF